MLSEKRTVTQLGFIKWKALGFFLTKAVEDQKSQITVYLPAFLKYLFTNIRISQKD